MNRHILIGVVAALALAGIVAWWTDLFGLRADDDNAALTLYGNVDIRQVELGFRVPGRIAIMHFEEGDRVIRAAPLALLDRQPYLDELRLAEAQAAAAAANLAKMEAGSRVLEIDQAQALVAERQASLDNARRIYKRRKELVKTGAVTREAFDDAEAVLRETEARLNSARKTLALVEDGFRDEDIAAARANLQSANAQVDAARTALNDTELLAPADGVILTRAREPGAVVASGATVYTLSLERPVWVRAYIAEPDLGRIRPGMPVSVITDTRPQNPYQGQIGFISPTAEFTPKSVETAQLRTDLVYRLRVIVSDVDEGLRQGMPVTVRVGAASDRKAE